MMPQDVSGHGSILLVLLSLAHFSFLTWFLVYLVGKQLNCVCIFYCCVLGGRLSSHLHNVKYLQYVSCMLTTSCLLCFVFVWSIMLDCQNNVRLTQILHRMHYACSLAELNNMWAREDPDGSSGMCFFQCHKFQQIVMIFFAVIEQWQQRQPISTVLRYFFFGGGGPAYSHSYMAKFSNSILPFSTFCKIYKSLLMYSV